MKSRPIPSSSISGLLCLCKKVHVRVSFDPTHVGKLVVQWPSGLASLAPNQTLLPLCGFDSHKWQIQGPVPIRLSVERHVNP